MDSQSRNRLDNLLDEALKRYSDVEPSVGLERRVLANLAAHATRTRARWILAWAAAGVIGAVLVVGVWLGHLSDLKSHNDFSIRVRHAVIPRSPTPPVVSEVSRHRESRPRRSTSQPRVTVKAEPKLKQFPSSHPISREELLVAEYTVRHPQDALLVVQEQQNFEEQVRRAQAEVEDSLGTSDQRER
jgi:hypothetical protein